MFTITIDDREQKILPFFKEKESYLKQNNILIKIDRITTGDYCISWNPDISRETDSIDHILFIIERKTWKDLASSIKDGRKNNLSKLLELKKEHPICKIIYLIEGPSRYSENKKICRIPYKNLQAHLDHLIQRDGVFIIYSKNNEDTYKRLFEFIKNYSTINPSPMLNIKGGENKNNSKKGLSILKKSFIKTDLDIIYDIWCCIPYITTKTATLFIEQNITINDFLLKTRDEVNVNKIYIMKYPSGFIIGKRANKITKIQNLTDKNNNKYYISMLTCIRGITKKTATLIINKFGMLDLLKNKVDKDKIINLKKTPKTIIGNKITNDIFKYFIN